MQKLKTFFINYKKIIFNFQNILIAIIFFCIGFFVFSCFSLSDKILTSIIQSLATLAAAFFGAWFAFLLQAKSKKEEEINKQVSSCNKAIFTMLQRINMLRLYQKHFIDPHRDKPAAFLFIRAARDYGKEDTIFDIHSLNFFIDYNQTDILLKIYMVDQSYKATVDCINYHSELHINQVQPFLEKAGFKEEQEQNIQYFKDALGIRLFSSLERAVNDLIYNVDQTIQDSIKIKDEFQKIIKSIFHNKVFIDFKLIDKKD